ncbi:hypothetical protein ACJX0J_009068, partial [Zea mays]
MREDTMEVVTLYFFMLDVAHYRKRSIGDTSHDNITALTCAFPGMDSAQKIFSTNPSIGFVDYMLEIRQACNIILIIVHSSPISFSLYYKKGEHLLTYEHKNAQIALLLLTNMYSQQQSAAMEMYRFVEVYLFSILCAVLLLLSFLQSTCFFQIFIAMSKQMLAFIWFQNLINFGGESLFFYFILILPFVVTQYNKRVNWSISIFISCQSKCAIHLVIINLHNFIFFIVGFFLEPWLEQRLSISCHVCPWLPATSSEYT